MQPAQPLQTVQLTQSADLSNIADLPENEVLFKGYLQNLIAGANGQRVALFASVGDKTFIDGSREKKVNDFLKSQIKQVAENGGSTVFNYSFEEPIILDYAEYAEDATDPDPAHTALSNALNNGT